MSNTIDESKLTAYALDELPAADRAAVEAYLVDHADARAAVAEIRETAAMLSGELARELAEPLPARATMKPMPPRWSSLRWKVATTAIAAAAAVAVSVVIYESMLPPTSPGRAGIHTTDDLMATKMLQGAFAATPVPQMSVPPIAVAQAPQPPKEIPGMFGPVSTTSGSNTAVTASAWKNNSNLPPDYAVASDLSPSHDQNGQNVLHGDGHTEFTNSPFNGMQRDNIYTRAANQTPFDTADSTLVPETTAKREFREANGNVAASTSADTYFHRIAGGESVTSPGDNPNSIPGAAVGGGAAGGGGGGSVSSNIVAGTMTLPGIKMADGRTFSGAASNINNSDATGLSYFHGNVAPVTTGGYRFTENDHQYLPSSGETGPNTETYPRFADNGFLPATQNPLSTFSIDVDTASYANIRRFLNSSQLPPPDAVRIEEMVNYFPYDYAGPKPGDDSPVAVHVEVADCPWEPSHRLARVALKAKTVAPHERPASNLVFLIDVSGSMGDANKLDLLKKSLPMLVQHLTSDDHVAIVTYAGETAVALPSTTCSDAAEPMSSADTAAAQKLWDNGYAPREIYVNGQVVNEKEVKAEYENALAKRFSSAMSGKQRILSAIDNLNANGSTNGGAGIQLAYSTAVSGFIKGGVNRVILATDGDFNVGVVDPDELTKMIEKQAQTGVYLTVLGMGMGNVKDATMEKLADHGHGNYAYIDSLEEANKVLSRQMDSTLITVAKDVKVQVEFNPAKVAGYRLVGYEDRAMAREDFNNDQKSAGDMGAGHAVTALYEIVPNGVVLPAGVDPLKYQPAVKAPTTNPAGNELLTVKVRYKQPDVDASQKLEVPVADTGEVYEKASGDFRFASAVASLGMLLRNSPYKGNATFDAVIAEAQAAKGEDVGGYRTEFVELAKKAKAIAGP